MTIVLMRRSDRVVKTSKHPKQYRVYGLEFIGTAQLNKDDG